MDFNTLLVVCPLVFLGGFVDAVGGGGTLIAVPAYLLAGIPPHMAIGTNKLSSCMGKAASIHPAEQNSEHLRVPDPKAMPF